MCLYLNIKKLSNLIKLIRVSNIGSTKTSFKKPTKSNYVSSLCIRPVKLWQLRSLLLLCLRIAFVLFPSQTRTPCKTDCRLRNAWLISHECTFTPHEGKIENFLWNQMMQSCFTKMPCFSELLLVAFLKLLNRTRKIIFLFRFLRIFIVIKTHVIPRQNGSAG